MNKKPFLLCFLLMVDSLSAKIVGIEYPGMQEGLACFKASEEQIETIKTKILQNCPAKIAPIFDQNPRWRSYFAKKCPQLLLDPDLEGEFGKVCKEEEPELSLEYAFFPGSSNRHKLIVVASGGFFDKHFALPYVILLNKTLGYSCLLVDYRGHENSWSKTTKKPLMRHKSCGVDPAECTFGKKEGEDFCDAICQILQAKPYLKEVHALGACFGAIVVARAHNVYEQKFKRPLFESFFFISPLPSIGELLLIMLKDPNCLKSFIKPSVQTSTGISDFYSAVNFICNTDLPWFNNLIMRSIAACFGIKLFNGLEEFATIQQPVMVLASEDSDHVVTQAMTKMVWEKIPSQDKALLWSSGVGHLFNWHEEMAELTLALERFFAAPREAVHAPMLF